MRHWQYTSLVYYLPDGLRAGHSHDFRERQETREGYGEEHESVYRFPDAGGQERPELEIPSFKTAFHQIHSEGIGRRAADESQDAGDRYPWSQPEYELEMLLSFPCPRRGKPTGDLKQEHNTQMDDERQHGDEHGFPESVQFRDAIVHDIRDGKYEKTGRERNTGYCGKLHLHEAVGNEARAQNHRKHSERNGNSGIIHGADTSSPICGYDNDFHRAWR